MMAGHDKPAPGDARPALPALLPPNLNLFLFAGVGIERSGMTLTVLSALARLELDPWDEAGRLSKLSRAEAADSFAGSLARLPAMPRWPRGTTARLVALLPQDGSLRAAPATEPATASLHAVRKRAALLALLVVTVMLALGAIGHCAAAADRGAAALQASPDVPRTAPGTARNGAFTHRAALVFGYRHKPTITMV